MEGALVNRAIAEKAKCDSIFVSILARERQASRERDVRADDGVTSVHVIFLVEKMHRTAEPLRTARRFSEKFRHARVRARATPESVTVIPISGDDVIIVAHGRDRTGDHGFLTDVKMAEPADLLRLILLAGAFFEAPDP